MIGVRDRMKNFADKCQRKKDVERSGKLLNPEVK
jgi:hypothetical protein